MGNFKNYILNEEIGLGNLGINIQKLANSNSFANQINGALNNPAWNGLSFKTPEDGEYNKNIDVNMSFVSTVRSGRITHLRIKNNPIYVRLSDGTECNFTYDEFKRIEGIPKIGKVMHVTFQRHPNYSGADYSKIKKAVVVD